MINKIKNISPVSQKPALNYKFLLIIVLIAVGFLFYSNLTKTKLSSSSASPAPTPQSDKPQVLSVKPGSAQSDILLQNQPIEITFNRPLENSGEFKHEITPKFKYRLETSSDRKIIKITPEESYQVGTEYTLFIKPETKFDGAQNLGEEKIYHFKTIQYRGV